jgi:hypothetical protein
MCSSICQWVNNCLLAQPCGRKAYIEAIYSNFTKYLCFQKVYITAPTPTKNVLGFYTTECREGKHEQCIAAWADDDLIVLCMCPCGNGRHAFRLRNKNGNSDNTDADTDTSDTDTCRTNTVGYIFKDCREGQHTKCCNDRLGRNLRIVCLCLCRHPSKHEVGSC